MAEQGACSRAKSSIPDACGSRTRHTKWTESSATNKGSFWIRKRVVTGPTATLVPFVRSLAETTRHYLHHKSEALGEFFLASGAVIPTFRKESTLSRVLNEIPSPRVTSNSFCSMISLPEIVLP